MLRAVKANRKVRIPDEMAGEYRKLGYRIMTLEGELVSEPVKEESVIEKLQEEIEMLSQKNTELEQENESLRSENATKKPARKPKLKQAEE